MVVVVVVAGSEVVAVAVAGSDVEGSEVEVEGSAGGMYLTNGARVNRPFRGVYKYQTPNPTRESESSEKSASHRIE